MKKKEVVEIVKEVIDELGKEAKGRQKEQELQPILNSVKHTEEAENISEEQKKMFLALLAHKELFITKKYDDPAKLDAFLKEQKAYDEENEIRVINIAVGDGGETIELRVPKEDFKDFNKLLLGTAAYWDKMTEKLNDN